MYQYNHTPLYIFHKLLSVYSCLSDTQYDFIAIVLPPPLKMNMLLQHLKSLNYNNCHYSMYITGFCKLD